MPVGLFSAKSESVESFSRKDVCIFTKAILPEKSPPSFACSRACGIKELIVTNAAGTANKDFAPGSWMMIADHINLTGTTPLLGEPKFIDMSDCYSPQMRARFRTAAKQIGMTLHEGVYAGLLGPQYETPAEVRMLRSLGADAIGMSTVLEVIQARALGMEVAGFSCLTNWAAGMGAGKLEHAEVLETGKAAAASFARLLQAAF